VLHAKMVQCRGMCGRAQCLIVIRNRSIKYIFQYISTFNIYIRRHSVDIMNAQGVQGIGRELSSGLSLPSDVGSIFSSGANLEKVSARGPRVEHMVAPREDTVANLVREAFNLPQVRVVFMLQATDLQVLAIQLIGSIRLHTYFRV